MIISRHFLSTYFLNTGGQVDNKRHIWHPCHSFQNNSADSLMTVDHATGPHLFLKDGSKVIDAISSWWCKSFGHNHPRLRAALFRQAERYEHAIHANTTNDVLEQLAQRLSRLSPGLEHVFFASDGACAVEIAMKLSLHSRALSKETQRTQFISLQNSYHGETCGALSVSDSGKFKQPYTALLFDTHFIGPLPYVLGRSDPLWNDCSEHWAVIEKQLMPLANTATALLVEPMVQGSAGMQIYSPDLLRRLSQWCQHHHVHLIADEIMTGLGRTGKNLACEHAQIQPDFVTLSKGLTAGWLPCSAVLIHEKIHHLFAEHRESFLHSHTFGGNPLAASIALETLIMLDEYHINDVVTTLESSLLHRMHTIAEKTGRLNNVRGLGGLVAADVLDATPQQIFQLCQRATKMGALLRPLGHVVYWLPPFLIEEPVLDELQEITMAALLTLDS